MSGSSQTDSAYHVLSKRESKGSSSASLDEKFEAIWMEREEIFSQRDCFGRLPKGAQKLRGLNKARMDILEEKNNRQRQNIHFVSSHSDSIPFLARDMYEEDLHRTIPDWYYAVSSLVSMGESASSGRLSDSEAEEPVRPAALEKAKGVAFRIRQSMRGLSIGKEIVNRVTSIEIGFGRRSGSLTRSEGEERPWDGPRPGRNIFRRADDSEKKVERTFSGELLHTASSVVRAAEKLFLRKQVWVRIPLQPDETPEPSWVPTSECKSIGSDFGEARGDASGPKHTR